ARPGTVVNLPRTASVTPSAKYASLVSPRFSNGSTATRRGPVEDVVRLCERHAKSTPTPITNPRPRSANPIGDRCRVLAALTALGGRGAGEAAVVRFTGLAAADRSAVSSACANCTGVANRSAGIGDSAF